MPKSRTAVADRVSTLTQTLFGEPYDVCEAAMGDIAVTPTESAVTIDLGEVQYRLPRALPVGPEMAEMRPNVTLLEKGICPKSRYDVWLMRMDLSEDEGSLLFFVYKDPLTSDEDYSGRIGEFVFWVESPDSEEAKAIAKLHKIEGMALAVDHLSNVVPTLFHGQAVKPYNEFEKRYQQASKEAEKKLASLFKGSTSLPEIDPNQPTL